jgi:hypothetical protein
VLCERCTQKDAAGIPRHEFALGGIGRRRLLASQVGNALVTIRQLFDKASQNLPTLARAERDGMQKPWQNSPPTAPSPIPIKPLSKSSKSPMRRGRAGRCRIYIEKINGPMLFVEKATPAEYKAGLDLAIARGWLVLHRSGTFVRFTQAGAELFA